VLRATGSGTNLLAKGKETAVSVTRQTPAPTTLWDEINALLLYTRELQNQSGWPDRFPLPAVQQLELTRVLDRPLAVKDLWAIHAIVQCALLENELPAHHRDFFQQSAADITDLIQRQPNASAHPQTASI
jgi:hypothetical protein